MFFNISKNKSKHSVLNKIDRYGFFMFFKKIPIYLVSLKIWKTQKDTRLTAKTYLKTLSQKEFYNIEEIKNKQQKNKEYYFEKLKNLELKHTNTIKKITLELNNLLNSNCDENNIKIVELNKQIIFNNQNYVDTKEKLIHSYHAMNYLIQYKPYVYNQEIDLVVTNIKDRKIDKLNKRINKFEKLIQKSNEKLNKLINPEPKIIKNKDGSIIKLDRAPIDINKPNKKALNLINNINVYESKKQKIVAIKLNVEHEFDLIKQQWKRNKFHELITNPYYNTHH